MKERTIRIGIALGSASGGRSANSAAATRAHLDAFCRALSGAISREVTGTAVPDYPGLLCDLAEGRVDLTWLPPVIALQAATARRVLPLALPTRGGSASFYAGLFAREGSRLRSAEDLEGARAAWVDPFSASGYLVIRAALRSRGIRIDRAFSEERFVGSHERVVQAVALGQADVGSTFLHYDHAGRLARAGWGSEHMQIVTSFGPIPSDVIAASVHMPAADTRRLKQALLGGEHADLTRAAKELLEADGFVAAVPSHLTPLSSLLQFLDGSPRDSIADGAW